MVQILRREVGECFAHFPPFWAMEVQLAVVQILRCCLRGEGRVCCFCLRFLFVEGASSGGAREGGSATSSSAAWARTSKTAAVSSSSSSCGGGGGGRSAVRGLRFLVGMMTVL